MLSVWDNPQETTMNNTYDEKRILKQLSNPATSRQAFAEVVAQYGEQLYWSIRRMVLVHDDANDILQNTFIKAWTNLADFQGRSKFSTWLHRIAINECLTFVRKQKLTANIYTDEDNGVANMLMADEYFDGDEVQALLQQAIASLPEVQRQVFCLRYYDDMKYSEMSTLLGTSQGALKASYHLAVKKIQDFLTNMIKPLRQKIVKQ